ncbi:MAG: DUF1002 domain-containing protein [Lachnospiraceae bacterium]|nr:DUF1002 domain-containing protein [Lachnospiraceae bacterium]
MKKFNIKKLTGIFIAAAMISASSVPQIVLADGQKVVTLGADLTQAQMDTIRKYFGVNGKNIETIYVTNADEHALLGGSIPREQIGTHAISCAYVQPTNSGGIKVKTANLSYVTANMIAAALSTSGVVNCNVIAAAPFEVSGTGALTGVLKAYETATGNHLSDTKKSTAVREMVTTGKIADKVGRTEATKIVNNIKKEIITQNITVNEVTEITNIVNNVINDIDVTKIDIDIDNINDIDINIDPEIVEDLIEFAGDYADEDYDYDDVIETIDNIDENVNPDHEAEAESEASETDSETTTDADTDEAADADLTDSDAEPSILDETDADAFDVDIIEDSTEESELDSEAEAAEETDSDLASLFEITTTDGTDNWDTETDHTSDQNTDTWNQETTDQPDNELDPGDNTDDWDWDYTDDGTDDGTDTPAADEDTPDVKGDDGFDWDSTDDFGETDGDVMTDENTEDVDAGDVSAETPEAVFALDSSFGNASFDPFAVVFYVNGDYTPANGTLTIRTADGSTAATVDLSDSSNWGVLPVAESGDLYSLGWSSANQIWVFLKDASLYDANYQVTVEAALKDAAGNVTDTVSAAAEMDFTQSSISMSGSGFTAGSSATLSFSLPEEAAYATISTSDPSVIAADTDTVYAGEGSSVSMSLYTAGEAYVYVDYCSEEGDVLYTDSLTVAVF